MEPPNDDLLELCISCSDSKQQSTMVYNSLRRGDIFRGIHGIANIDELRESDIDTLCKIRNVGPKSIAIIKKMKEKIKEE